MKIEDLKLKRAVSLVLKDLEIDYSFLEKLAEKFRYKGSEEQYKKVSQDILDTYEKGSNGILFRIGPFDLFAPTTKIKINSLIEYKFTAVQKRILTRYLLSVLFSDCQVDMGRVISEIAFKMNEVEAKKYNYERECFIYQNSKHLMFEFFFD